MPSVLHRPGSRFPVAKKGIGEGCNCESEKNTVLEISKSVTNRFDALDVRLTDNENFVADCQKLAENNQTGIKNFRSDVMSRRKHYLAVMLFLTLLHILWPNLHIFPFIRRDAPEPMNRIPSCIAIATIMGTAVYTVNAGNGPFLGAEG